VPPLCFVATCPVRWARAPTLADLLAAADQALYRAKSLGGNRLELARTGVRGTATC